MRMREAKGTKVTSEEGNEEGRRDLGGAEKQRK